MRNGFIIVDDHIHMFSSSEMGDKIIKLFNHTYTIDFNNSGNGSVEDTLSKMKQFGIDFSILSNFSTLKHLDRNNRWSLEVAKQHHEFVPLVSLHPELENVSELFKEYISLGAKGLKLHPMAQIFDPRDKRLDAVYQMCSKRKLPVVFHCGRVSNARLNEFSDLDHIEPVMKKYPEMPVVLTHMADGNRKDVRRIAANYPNAYFDTSIVISGYDEINLVNVPSWPDDLDVISIMEGIGASRMMYGSDHPWGHPGLDLERFLKMDISDKDKKCIVGQNAVGLFQIKV